MRYNRSNQAKLGAVIGDVLRQAGLEQKLAQGQIMLAWKDIVGPANARHSWPVRVKDGVLLVGCSSAAWTQTMMMLRMQIMDKIAKLYGECPVREIHFSGVREPRSWFAEDEKLAPPPAKIALPVEQVQWIDSLTAEISEPALQQRARAALGSLLRQREWHHTQGHFPCADCGRLHHNKSPYCNSCQKKQDLGDKL
jgi:predicted nucleic acid-binding Zn ribbon protein